MICYRKINSNLIIRAKVIVMLMIIIIYKDFHTKFRCIKILTVAVRT